MISRKPIFPPLAALLFSLALVLLAVVDFRRGFLPAPAEYTAKSSFFVFSPLQLVLAALGIAGLLTFRRALKAPDARTSNRLLVGIFVLLLADAVLYRGVAASRSIDAGKIGLDWLSAFGADRFWKPFALSASYVLTVWHATFLSCLGAGLGWLALPRLLKDAQERPGWRGSVAGTLYALTQPFCSCCVALTSHGLFRSRRSMNFGLAVILGAPLLNLSTLILAGNLLPWPFAVLRAAGGLAITLTLSFLLSKWIVGEAAGISETRATTPTAPAEDSPSALFSSWLAVSGKIALVLVPGMILGTVLSSAVWSLWPQGMGNSIASVFLTAVIGSLVMVTTWSEIPLASQMIQHGMTGPAAAALVALPAVNLGSLLIVGKISRSWKAAVGLGVGVMAASALIGAAFL